MPISCCHLRPSETVPWFFPPVRQAGRFAHIGKDKCSIKSAKAYSRASPMKAHCCPESIQRVGLQGQRYGVRQASSALPPSSSPRRRGPRRVRGRARQGVPPSLRSRKPRRVRGRARPRRPVVPAQAGTQARSRPRRPRRPVVLAQAGTQAQCPGFPPTRERRGRKRVTREGRRGSMLRGKDEGGSVRGKDEHGQMAMIDFILTAVRASGPPAKPSLCAANTSAGMTNIQQG